MSRRDSDIRDEELHAFLRQALSRRGFLRRSALGGLVLGNGLLAACGGGKEGARVTRGDSAIATGGTPGRTLRISNWPLYIDKRTIPDFEKATGAKVEYTEDINDNDEFFAKIDEPLKRNRSIDRDIIVLTDWMAGRLINLGYVAPLDERKFPNKVNLVDDVRDVSFDPGRKYSVPWVSGMTGLGYNPKKIGKELTSINDIFDPRYKGQVTMLTEMRDTLGLVMLGMGRDPTKATRADVEAAGARIKKARQSGQIRKFTGNDYAEDLAAGNIAIAFAWSGDIQGLAADNPDLEWIAPREGAMLYSDNMLIPKTSDRQNLAMAWVNYVYDPRHSAQIVAGAPYLSAVKGTGAELAKIAPALARSPLVNPPDELRRRLHVFRALSDAEDLEYNRIFQNAIGA
jgi:spermidine/putrescine transport system substrate-binding protein